MEEDKYNELKEKAIKNGEKVIGIWETTENVENHLIRNGRIKEYVTMHFHFGNEPNSYFYELNLEIEDRDTIGFVRAKLHFKVNGIYLTTTCNAETTNRLIKCFDKYIAKNYMMSR